LAKEQSFSVQENTGSQTETASHFEGVATAKKTFVEPELSSPVDVLEATTFFQSATSGATN
jgi:hypothetical protein